MAKDVQSELDGGNYQQVYVLCFSIHLHEHIYVCVRGCIGGIGDSEVNP